MVNTEPVPVPKCLTVTYTQETGLSYSKKKKKKKKKKITSIFKIFISTLLKQINYWLDIFFSDSHNTW